MSEKVSCAREDPHPGHYWNEPDWEPRWNGDKQYFCPGKEDPAVLALSDEQLRLAKRELGRREDAARRACEQERARQRRLAEGELDIEYRGKLTVLLKEAGWEAPSVPVVAHKLLESVYDLMDDFREARDNL